MAHNTKIKNRRVRKHHNCIAIFITCALVIAVGFFVFLLIQSHNNESKPIESSGDNQAITTSEPVATQEKPASATTSRETEKPSVSQYEGQDANTYDELSGFINYAGVIGGNLSIRATISQAVSGSCEMTLTDGAGGKLNFVSEIDNGPSASFCMQDVPVAQLNGERNWRISIVVKGNDKTGTIIGEVSI